MRILLTGLLLVCLIARTSAQPLLIVAKEKGKKYGYIDTSGNYLIQPQYDDAQPFSEGYAVVKVGEKYGVINERGEYVLKPQYDKARDFVSQGKLSVWSYDSAAWASVRMDGSQFIRFDRMLGYLTSFYKGYAISGEYGGDGRISVTVFDSVGNETALYSTLEAYRTGKKEKQMTETVIFEPKIRYGRIPSTTQEGPIDYGVTTFPKGEELSIYATYFSVYREGLLPGSAYNGVIPYYKPGTTDEEYDSTGRKPEPIAFTVRGEMGYPFFNGIAAIEQDGLWAFIDREGKVVGKTSLTKKEYNASPPMYFGGLVGFFKGKKVGYVNLKGEVIIPFEYTEYHPFEYDVTPVQKGGKYGLLKKDGTWAVEPRFEMLDIGLCPCYR